MHSPSVRFIYPAYKLPYFSLRMLFWPSQVWLNKEKSSRRSSKILILILDSEHVFGVLDYRIRKL